MQCRFSSDQRFLQRGQERACSKKMNKNEHPMTPAMQRAQEYKKTLAPDIPNDLRLMTKSHVSGGYWMGLSKEFSKYLPSTESTLVLEDQKGDEFPVVYKPDKHGLSGGWRKFAIGHGLEVDDVLIFQRVPLKLKVHIFKENQLTEVGGAMPMDTDGHKEDTSISIPDNDVDPGYESDISFSEVKLKFKDVKDLEDFKVEVDGIIYKSGMISTGVKQKYYELCRSQDKFLHENVTAGYNIKLIAGMIAETVNIADNVKQVKTTTSIDKMKQWNKTLDAFEELGMYVEFLRARIRTLFSVHPDAVIESKSREKDEALEEEKSLKENFFGVTDMAKKLDSEIGTLKEKSTAHYDRLLMDIAGAPW